MPTLPTREQFLRNLQILDPRSIPEADRTCIVCSEEYSSRTGLQVRSHSSNSEPHWLEKPVRLPCNHIIGEQCLINWVSTCKRLPNGRWGSFKNTCPHCRRMLFEDAEPRTQSSVHRRHLSDTIQTSIVTPSTRTPRPAPNPARTAISSSSTRTLRAAPPTPPQHPLAKYFQDPLEVGFIWNQLRVTIQRGEVPHLLDLAWSIFRHSPLAAYPRPVYFAEDHGLERYVCSKLLVELENLVEEWGNRGPRERTLKASLLYSFLRYQLPKYFLQYWAIPWQWEDRVRRADLVSEVGEAGWLQTYAKVVANLAMEWS